MSRIVDIPPPRRGRREFAEDTGVRLGLHIKAAEQAMMAAKTEALRSFGVTVAQYATMLSLYYVPEQSSAQLARAAAVTPQTMATVIAKLEQKRLVTRPRVALSSAWRRPAPRRSVSSSPRCLRGSLLSCGAVSTPSSGRVVAGPVPGPVVTVKRLCGRA